MRHIVFWGLHAEKRLLHQYPDETLAESHYASEIFRFILPDRVIFYSRVVTLASG